MMRWPARAPWLAPALLLALFVLLALITPLLVETPPEDFRPAAEAAGLPPSIAYPFGTDLYGRDVVGLVLYGLRVSLGVAVASMLLAIALGTGYGIVAGWIGGAVENALLRLLDVCLAIPRVLALLAVVTFWGGSTPVGVAVVLGLTGWFDIARLVRAEVSALRTRDWLVAARAGGVPPHRIVGRHLLPHLAPTVGVSGSLTVASAVGLEAGLSYLGLGVQPPSASLGRMLAEGVPQFPELWWLSVFPGLAIAVLVFTVSALGDALRTPARQGQVAA